MRKHLLHFAFLAAAFILVLTACGPTPTAVVTEPPVTTEEATEPPATEPPASAVPAIPNPPTIGWLLVGTKNDFGWTQAHYDASLYLEQKIPGLTNLYIENVYSGSPVLTGTTRAQLAEQLVAQGADLIVFNSDDMMADSTVFAQDHPEVPVIMASGDQVWADGQNYTAVPNLTNIMGRMETMKMLAGCSAALTTQTGKIGYLGPLINAETRRFASSAFLGAKYCWTRVLGNDAADLTFDVTWIGFWFYIPGFSSDPTQVANNFFNSGYDVVISGIDTTEALVEAKRLHDAGQAVWAVTYDYAAGCDFAPEICLGVPYFNWGPGYLDVIQSAMDGTWVSSFNWNGPDWANIADPDTSAVGFTKGPALSEEASTNLDVFLAELAGGLNLWTGPINLQDGTVYLTDGQVATDQEVWYLPQLLEGMGGDSVPAQ
jgi:simple sugar transport system substrate-binding protein